MRRLTSVRSVMESRPASHARLTPRYASRSAAAYSALIVSGILPPQLPDTWTGGARAPPMAVTVRTVAARSCIDTGERGPITGARCPTIYAAQDRSRNGVVPTSPAVSQLVRRLDVDGDCDPVANDRRALACRRASSRIAMARMGLYRVCR